jgi:hypothetical protein
VPSGTYLHLDPLDASVLAIERFSCAPGPAGWRYVADITAADGTPRSRVDLAVDARWRPARLELRSGGWLVRGGAAGPGVLWVRSAGSEAVEHSAPTPGFAGPSPAFLIATARMLALAEGAPAQVGLTQFSDGALGASTIRQQWVFTERTEHPADGESLTVAHFRVSDLDTGEVSQVAIAGDVVLAAAGFELDELDGPPNRFRDAW